MTQTDLATLLPLAGNGLLVIAAWGVVLWIVSLRLRDASIADPFWAPGFLVLGSSYWALRSETGSRGLIALTLTAVWAGRLGWHLLVRNRREGEDRRYRAMRAHHGEAFWWVSLFTVFLLQGFLLWLVAMPILVAVVGVGPLGVWDAVGAILAATGLLLEAIADAQLKGFRSDPANEGAVMDRGLWRYSRHPNYFGNAVMWWGLFLIAVGGGGAWSGVGPLIMTVLLLRVSGVTLLERDISDRRPGYREYVRRTSSFVPWPPRTD